MILCTHCSHQNKKDSQFCTSCGNRLVDEPCIAAHLKLLGKSEQREFLVSDEESYIGRDASNDIVLDDAEMSARHARIGFRDGGFWVEDLDSTNGTYVNGTRIDAPTFLHDEDLLKMGRTLLQLKI